MPLLRQIKEKYQWDASINTASGALQLRNLSDCRSFLTTIGPFINFGQKVQQRDLINLHWRDKEANGGKRRVGSALVEWKHTCDERKKQLSAMKRM
jgi:hypothetical protein